MKMTTRERVQRVFDRKEIDRLPILDVPWDGTLARWYREGIPAGMDWRDYFDVDKMERIHVNISPNYPIKVLEDGDDYQIVTTEWGVTMKRFKEMDSTPEFLDFTVTDAKEWAYAKKKMAYDETRVDWAALEQNNAKWTAEGRIINALFWFGFDVTHSWMMGTENCLIMMMEEPELLQDIYETYLDACIRCFDEVLKRGYHLDGIFFPDDMGFKNTTFFSKETYRELLKPYHTKAAQWAHKNGLKVNMHSCGCIMSLMDDIIETGIDSLNPIEIKAGMDVRKLKDNYGDKLVFHGGIDALKWGNKDAVIAEIDKNVPILAENGGYVFASDHTIPNNTSLETMRAIVERVKQFKV